MSNCLISFMGKIFTKAHGRNDRQKYMPDTAANEGGNDIRLFEPVHTEPVTAVAAGSSGLCVSGSQDKSVALFDYQSGQMVQRWTGHNQAVTKLTYGEQVCAVFSGSRDRTIRMWRAADTKPVNTFSGHDMVVTGLTLNSSNSQLCSGSRDNSLRIWNVDTAQCIRQNSTPRNLITHVQWAKDTDFIAQTGEDKQLKIWDSRTLSPVTTFAKKMYIQTCCDISEDNNYCVTSSNGFTGNGCELTLWDLRMGSILREYKGHHETVHACLFIPYCVGQAAGNLIVSSASDCTVRIWHRETCECVAWLEIPGSGPLTSLAVYADGSLCVASYNCGIHMLKLSVDKDSVQVERKAQF